MRRAMKTEQFLQETGRVLSRLGHWGIPLSLGIIAGYQFSDHDVSFVPVTLGIVTVILIVSFAFLPLGRLLQGRAFVDTPEKRKVRKRIIVLTVLCLLAALGRLGVHLLEEPAPLTELNETAYADAFQIDIQRYRSLNASLKGVEDYLDTRKSLFEQDAGVLNATAEKEMLQMWQTLYDTSIGMDEVRLFHEDWYRFDPSRLQRDSHVGSFLLMYAAELAMYRTGLKATRLISQNKSVEHFLNSPHPGENLPNNNYSVFKEVVTGYDTLTRVSSAGQYLRWIRETMPMSQIVGTLGLRSVLAQIEADEQTLTATDFPKKAWAGMRADVQPLKRQFRRSWFPAQKHMAQAMGDTRLRRIGKYLITEPLQKKAIRMLKPGDVLLTRKNWYLSNVGLPGFWPHAILFVGTPLTLDNYFDTPEVREWVTLESDGQTTRFSELLARRFPQKWRQYNAGNGGEPYRLVEAIGEGVVFNTLRHSAGDYLAAVRPRLNHLRKAQAILQAFALQGKPYDFNFDFATDDALVCTELVWRAYRPDESGNGLEMPLVEIMGRQTLPANEIAKLYADTREYPGRQLDFVFFIDASESEQRAFFADEAAFVESSRRTRWDLQLP